MFQLGNIILRIRKRLRTIGVSVHRFKVHSAATLRFTGLAVELLAVLASVACIVCMLVLMGYDQSMAHREELKLLLSAKL